jgi:hypothetical protein
MAVIRFTLDGPSVLDDELFGLGGPSAFILDASTLDGDRVLDGGQFLTTATGTATLGALSATATSTVTHFATATAELGELVADIAEVIVTTEATAEAQLGGLVATATATVVLPATASAELGSLVASAVTAVEQNAVAVANLGGLVATVNSIPTPPAPEPTPAPSGGRRVYSTTPRKKIEPLPPVEIPVIEPKRRYAVTTTSLGGMMSQASAEIVFSILDDDAEVLLLV